MAGELIRKLRPRPAKVQQDPHSSRPPADNKQHTSSSTPPHSDDKNQSLPSTLPTPPGNDVENQGFQSSPQTFTGGEIKHQTPSSTSTDGDSKNEATAPVINGGDKHQSSVQLSKKRKRGSKKPDTEGEGGQPKKQKARGIKTKSNPYGLMPGQTPYPDWKSPSAEECQIIYNILGENHKDVDRDPPEIVPAPSLEVAGCGEVNSVLDALLRTVLSGSTTFESADKMVKALVKKYGILKEGIGKGSIDWYKVRIASYDEVYKTLKFAGLAANKAKNIQSILNMVHDENMQRREAYIHGNTTDLAEAPAQTKGHWDLEILKDDNDLLSLDHMYDMTKDEAMSYFVRYPGVGVKTAACVTLFCLQEPCFAVDTHVWRLSKWLGWVPPKADMDKTYSHLEVRCPDHLKYGLHQLMIAHGKACARCNDHTWLGTPAYNNAQCCIENYMNRFSKRGKNDKTGNASINDYFTKVTKVKDDGVKESAQMDEVGGEDKNQGNGETKDGMDSPYGRLLNYLDGLNQRDGSIIMGEDDAEDAGYLDEDRSEDRDQGQGETKNHM